MVRPPKMTQFWPKCVISTGIGLLKMAIFKLAQNWIYLPVLKKSWDFGVPKNDHFLAHFFGPFSKMAKMTKIAKIAKTVKNRRLNLKIPKMTKMAKTVKKGQKGCSKKGSIFGPPTPKMVTQPSLPPGGDRPFWPIFWPLFDGPSKKCYSCSPGDFKSVSKVFQKCPKHAIFWHVFRPPEPQNHGFWPLFDPILTPFWPLLTHISKYAYF